MQEISIESGLLRYLSVQDVMRILNEALEVEFPQILFTGEISQLTQAQSGHIYFTVKDERAQVSCALWAGVARSLKCKPRVGMTVKCHGRPSLYGQTGRFQIIVNKLIEAGEGELQQRFLELKQRLEQEGLFSPERKRPIPFLPKGIGVVTSRTGAVIHDMMVKIHERFPSVPVYLSDTRVQGEGVAKEIANAIRKIDASELVDVIIVARGGGSLEDLWQFNEEEVVRAVFACRKPVVSGVGHEVDTTLCDLVADVRAPTPTAAAELVVPRRIDLLERVDHLSSRLEDSDRWFQPMVQRVDDLLLRLQTRFRGIYKESELRVRVAGAALAKIKPLAVIELRKQKLAGLERDLLGFTKGRCRELDRNLKVLQARLVQGLGLVDCADYEQKIRSLALRLAQNTERRLEFKREKLGGLERRLASVSPEVVLSRGYGIISKGGTYLSSSTEICEGDAISITMRDGVLDATVKAKTIQ